MTRQPDKKYLIGFAEILVDLQEERILRETVRIKWQEKFTGQDITRSKGRGSRGKRNIRDCINYYERFNLLVRDDEYILIKNLQAMRDITTKRWVPR